MSVFIQLLGISGMMQLGVKQCRQIRQRCNSVVSKYTRRAQELAVFESDPSQNGGLRSEMALDTLAENSHASDSK